KRTDVLFYFSDFQNRQKTGISYSPIPESVDPFFVLSFYNLISNVRSDKLNLGDRNGYKY
ncbi:hypothetical protein, partial [Pediococcus parvulus]|uniref:hypothetical protein n=1 Tax=Pediococcus parvulus TaxID=54062 RepID=UPI0021A7C4F9